MHHRVLFAQNLRNLRSLKRFSPVKVTDRMLHLQMVAVNLSAPIRLTRRLAPKMAERKDGLIINMSSVYRQVPSALWGVYAATKHRTSRMVSFLRGDPPASQYQSYVRASGLCIHRQSKVSLNRGQNVVGDQFVLEITASIVWMFELSISVWSLTLCGH